MNFNFDNVSSNDTRVTYSLHCQCVDGRVCEQLSKWDTNHLLNLRHSEPWKRSWEGTLSIHYCEQDDVSFPTCMRHGSYNAPTPRSLTIRDGLSALQLNEMDTQRTLFDRNFCGSLFSASDYTHIPVLGVNIWIWDSLPRIRLTVTGRCCSTADGRVPLHQEITK